MEKINTFYLNEINRISLLTREEEKALATKAYSGSKSAQNKLVEANLRLVIKIAHKYQGYMPLEDLINEGNMGLMHAAEKYNPASNAKFSTYAAWWVREFIQKAIRDTALGVRFPSAKYKEMKKDEWKFASLDKNVKGTDGETTILLHLIKDENSLNPEDDYIRKETSKNLSKSISKLKDTEQAVIVMRYGLNGDEPMSLSQVGNAIGCSKERVRQIEVKAIKELRSTIDSNLAA